MNKYLKLILLLVAISVDLFAGTGDAYGAKVIFEKIDAALGDTYVAAILGIVFLWRAVSIYRETGDAIKAVPSAALALGIGSLAALAMKISGAIF